ncbi:kinase [Dasania sp. GY-MA-18]|uniref:Kinase n=1 Tax=Dasania phycosphaerae TaxID=2950436 RepID=A0A9J6RPH3_9GAMM|nr:MULTISPECIES: kinase [Dasania]MCR8923808.1 kinase [Dasania sp. GY-MA-18]MCZ0866242.1 kinase [Dasania phycosphaerae]MCZ0869966.1 kinase [Dasania phycosphaerae]
MKNIEPYLKQFQTQHQLPDDYLTSAQNHYTPLINALLQQQAHSQQTLTLGINGSQGSGKTTMAAYLHTVLTHQHKLKVVSLSLDDFYLSKSARLQLAQTVHPLLATRGVPGTHDIALALTTLADLKKPGRVAIPRFNKASDDCVAREQWASINAPVDIIILEGWCLGAIPQSEAELLPAINSLEAQHDSDGRWRHYVNQQLAQHYQSLHEQIDSWAMLKAPSFDCIYQWRLQQEHKLASRIKAEQGSEQGASGVMSDKAVKEFVMYFQRITEHLLTTLPKKVDFLFSLDNNRSIANKTR